MGCAERIQLRTVKSGRKTASPGHNKMPENVDAHLLMAKILPAKEKTRRAISEVKLSMFFKDSVDVCVLPSKLSFLIEQFKHASSEDRFGLRLDPKR